MTVRFSEYSAPAMRQQPSIGLTYRFYGSFGKRVLDLVFVLITLPVALPLIAILALLVRLDGGSAFYWQERLGRHGRVFPMMKIRTMVPDAKCALDAYLDENPVARCEWEEKQKLLEDPRITWIGALLRKTSLDELPQLWNVFKGEMSLVGPRPMMVEQKGLYPGVAYFELRPGITGPWQVSDRNEASFADRAQFDLDYLGQVSLKTDLGLLIRTVAVVLKGTGV